MVKIQMELGERVEQELKTESEMKLRATGVKMLKSKERKRR